MDAKTNIKAEFDTVQSMLKLRGLRAFPQFEKKFFSCSVANAFFTLKHYIL